METGSGSRYYINTGTSDVSIDIGAAQPTAMNSDAFYIYSDSDNVANAYSTGIASGGYEGSLSVRFHVTFSIYGRNEYGYTTNQRQESASIYYAISTDGGVTFGSAVRITRQYLAWDEEYGSDDNPKYRVHIYGSDCAFTVAMTASTVIKVWGDRSSTWGTFSEGQPVNRSENKSYWGQSKYIKNALGFRTFSCAIPIRARSLTFLK